MKRITECKSGLSLIIVLLCFILQSNAQGVLSLEDCRRLAIENNKKLKIADEDVKASEAQRAEAFTRYLPSIDAVGVYLRNQKEINLLSDDAHLPVGSIGSDGKFTFRPDQLMMGADGNPVMVNGQYVPKDYALLPKEAMTVDERNLGIVQVGLTQPIYMGGKIRAYNQIAGLSEQLAKSKRSQELQNVILSTDEAYWQIVSLVNRKKLADKYVETLTKFVHDVELMHTTGGSNQSGRAFRAGETERGGDGPNEGGQRVEFVPDVVEPDLWLADRHDRDVERGGGRHGRGGGADGELGTGV